MSNNSNKFKRGIPLQEEHSEKDLSPGQEGHKCSSHNRRLAMTGP